MKGISVVFLTFLSLPALAAGRDKAECTRRELARKDCRVQKGDYEILMLADSIARDDGTWHMVDEMPLRGEGVQWERARFELMGDWPILQLWFWDAGKGEAAVQSLHWYVVDARKSTLKTLSEATVRRRRVKAAPKEGAEPAAAAGPGGKAPAPIYDHEEKHGLKADKQGRLEWFLGDQKKLLQRE